MLTRLPGGLIPIALTYLLMILVNPDLPYYLLQVVVGALSLLVIFISLSYLIGFSIMIRSRLSEKDLE